MSHVEGAPRLDQDESGLPLVSVVLLSRSVQELPRELLEQLQRQEDVPDGGLEVVVVACPGAGGLPENVKCVPPLGGSPVADWNQELAACRGEVVLFLEDDARPRPDLVARHLEAHARAGRPVAVAGLSARAREDEWLERCAPRDELLVGGEGDDWCLEAPLRSGARLGWRRFRLSNCSVPRRALEVVGGFDAIHFGDGVGADLELGYRLAESGLPLEACETAACEPRRGLPLSSWLERSREDGVAAARLWRCHRDGTLAWFAPGRRLDDEVFLEQLQRLCEAELPRVSSVVRALERHDVMRLPEREVTRLWPHLSTALTVATCRGVLAERTGRDPGPILLEGPPKHRRTTVVFRVRREETAAEDVAVLSRQRAGVHPFDLVVVAGPEVDLGDVEPDEEDGGVRVLRAAPGDVTRMVNVAFAEGRGEWAGLLDGVVPEDGWLRELLFHVEVDGRAAFAAAEAPTSEPAGHRRTRSGAASRRAGVVSSPCLLGRRSVLAELGGLDPRFSLDGWAIEDLTLRARLAGRHQRLVPGVRVSSPTPRDRQVRAHERRAFARKWRLGPEEPLVRALEEVPELIEREARMGREEAERVEAERDRVG